MSIDAPISDAGGEGPPSKRASSRRGRLVSGLSWVYWRHLCFGGLLGALVMFCLSLTPALLPRGWVLQGVVSGVTVAIGYGLGSMFSSWIRKVIPREPRPNRKRIAWWVLLAASVVLVPLFLFLGAQWQQTTRQLMGMDLPTVYEWFGLLAVTLVMASLLLIISRIVRGGTRGLIRLLDRWVPRTAAYIGGSTYTYGFDVAGNLKNNNGTSLDYNEANQISSAPGPKRRCNGRSAHARCPAPRRC